MLAKVAMRLASVLTCCGRHKKFNRSKRRLCDKCKSMIRTCLKRLEKLRGMM